MAGPERFFQDFRTGTLARHGASLRTLAEVQEISEDVGPELGVLDLRMELKAKEGPVAVSHRLDVAVLGAREGHEVPRSWVTSSLWDSHTSNRFGRPSKRTSGWWTCTMDLPNSGTLAGAASPPRCFAMNWCPAQIPRIGASNESRYSPFRPIFPGSTPIRGAPPDAPTPARPS